MVPNKANKNAAFFWKGTQFFLQLTVLKHFSVLLRCERQDGRDGVLGAGGHEDSQGEGQNEHNHRLFLAQGH